MQLRKFSNIDDIFPFHTLWYNFALTIHNAPNNENIDRLLRYNTIISFLLRENSGFYSPVGNSISKRFWSLFSHQHFKKKFLPKSYNVLEKICGMNIIEKINKTYSNMKSSEVKWNSKYVFKLDVAIDKSLDKWLHEVKDNLIEFYT